jgi:drug/metabolite transporter (DMT)-like permease
VNALHLAVPSALGAALCYGYASAVQHNESGQVERRGALNPGLLALLARRSRWWFGIGADVLAVVLQFVAFRYGPVALVQPLLIAGLPAAVLLSCLLQQRPVRSRELTGIAVCGAGITLIALVTRDTDASAPLSASAAAVASGCAIALLLALLGLARARPRTAGVATGAAAGLATGGGSVLLAVCAARIDDPGQLFRTAVPYATVAVGLLGLLLTQAAFQTGSIAAPLATLSLLEPASAVVLAATVLRQSLPTSLAAVIGIVVGSLMGVVGVAVLSLTGSHMSVTSPTP